MPNCYLMAQPIILINLGGEMIYILDQRLRAQNIDQEKGKKVLNDILKTIFAPKFLENIFEPSKTFSIQFARQLVEKFVHCSIMKLNETSLNKLFDLMLMGLKLQILNLQSPNDIYFLTLNHINGINQIVQQGSGIDSLQECKKLFIKKYQNLSCFEYIQIKSEILKFLHDKIVRVFMFMQENMQNNDGTFVISNNQELAAPFVGKPGQVVIYDSKEQVKKRKFLDLKVAIKFRPSTSTSFFEKCQTEWGQNLYAADRQKKLKEVELIDQQNNIINKQAKQTFANDEQLKSSLNMNPEAAKREINLLASLIKGNDAKNEENFSINLFSSKISTIQNKNQNVSDLNEDYTDMIMIDITTKENQKESEQDNLLDLMDSLNQ